LEDTGVETKSTADSIGFDEIVCNYLSTPCMKLKQCFVFNKPQPVSRRFLNDFSRLYRQVFWLPLPFGGLPVSINLKQWQYKTKKLLAFIGKCWGYSGGTTPVFHGIPY